MTNASYIMNQQPAFDTSAISIPTLRTYFTSKIRVKLFHSPFSNRSYMKCYIYKNVYFTIIEYCSQISIK